MIDAQRLLSDLKQMVVVLEEDLRERTAELPELDERLRAEHQHAREAERTAQAYEIWRDDYLTQVAVAWVLGCVFVRFLEDNRLIATPKLSGVGERRQRALDQHELYFRQHPTESDREYLYSVFEEVATLPAAREIFDREHNPIWALGLSGDGATRLLGFWQRLDPETGALDHDFTDPDWNTRFLGDLYQDLSTHAKKKYALLQTPEFVESFILDRTLTPAIDEFGFQEVRLIDPTCGSGHFLLGAFHRLFALWARHEPERNARDLAQRALAQVYGVDLNPFAVAIARFRLLVAALKACEVTRLGDAPGFHLNLAVGDSLLHGRRFGELALDAEVENLSSRYSHAYDTEDHGELDRILGQTYHAVVGNPPYITVKDKALNQLYRQRYSTCHRQYSLAVPFAERFFNLTRRGDATQTAGFTGMITANSFMKREFGKKLIEEFLPSVDLTHVIDTSGAYIPGHGTPTVILFGLERRPVRETVRTVMGIKGEPTTPTSAAEGRVWKAISAQVDKVGSESEWVSVEDISRKSFDRHPWSIGGGGANVVKELIESDHEQSLGSMAEAIGFVCITKADEVFSQPLKVFQRSGVSTRTCLRPFGIGEDIRDWAQEPRDWVIFPYDSRVRTISPNRMLELMGFMWPYRAMLFDRKVFGGQTYRQAGKPWYEYGQIPIERFRIPQSITFAFVATHNHFVLDRGGKVFKQSAPVIKLPAGATEDEHLALLGLLNSSTACFWLRQVSHPKTQTTGMDQEPWRVRREFTGTGLEGFPVSENKPLELARELDTVATQRQKRLPAQVVDYRKTGNMITRAGLDTHHDETDRLLGRMIALQEELDWTCYPLYAVTEYDLTYRDLLGGPQEPPPLALGERAFEIVMAKRMARGELTTTWFERHGSTPLTDFPPHWPEDYRRLVERRIALIQSDRNIGLVEQPEYKRRWNLESWQAQEQRALRGWLLDALEALFSDATEGSPGLSGLQSTARLADRVVQDSAFMQVGELYRGHADFDLPALVAELIETEAVPCLPVLRYKATGLRKRELWERTWDLQRQEDNIDAEIKTGLPRLEDESDAEFEARLGKAQKVRKAAEVGDISPPPKYRTADFLNSTLWRLRGALDVPKERFISLPHCARASDASLVVGWAGWDRLQQAQAVAGYYMEMKEQEGWTAEQLTPLLGALLELLPWVRQWHNKMDPEHGVRMGDYLTEFVEDEARALGLTPATIRAWTPPQRARRRKASQKTATANSSRSPGAIDA